MTNSPRNFDTSILDICRNRRTFPRRILGRVARVRKKGQRFASIQGSRLQLACLQQGTTAMIILGAQQAELHNNKEKCEKRVYTRSCLDQSLSLLSKPKRSRFLKPTNRRASGVNTSRAASDSAAWTLT